MFYILICWIGFTSKKLCWLMAMAAPQTPLTIIIISFKIWTIIITTHTSSYIRTTDDIGTSWGILLNAKIEVSYNNLFNILSSQLHLIY